MNRRDLILAAAASAGTLAAGLASGAAKPGQDQAGGAGNFSALADAAHACVKTGLICINHCQKELSQGNKSMAECLDSVLELVAACESLEKLALYGSAHTKEFAKVTAKICADCAKICEKHAHHMESCKACFEACKNCEKACAAA